MNRHRPRSIGAVLAVAELTPPSDERLAQLEHDAKASADRLARVEKELSQARSMHVTAVNRVAEARRMRRRATRDGE